MTAGRAWAQRVGPKVATRLPMSLALSTVAAVWLLGCVWSFTEQTAFARAKGFEDPALLPLVIDGLAASMGAVAFAASLDGRPALAARLGTALAVLASAASNGLWAAERSGAVGGAPDVPTVVVGAGIPVAANIAFEVLLAELRRQVQRRRGLPAPVPLPALRVARLLLAPGSTFSAWRREVLDVTSPSAALPAVPSGGPPPSGDGPRGPGGAREAGSERHCVEQTETAGSTSDVVDRAPTVEPTAPAAGSLDAVAVAVPNGPAVPSSEEGSGPSIAPDAEYEVLEVDPASRTSTPAPRESEEAPSRPPGAGVDFEAGLESNPKVWRLADYMRASGLIPENVSGDDVVALGLCQSSRNGRRLANRAAALCLALDGANPPERPDLTAVPRLLLEGEAPTLALVAREESR